MPASRSQLSLNTNQVHVTVPYTVYMLECDGETLYTGIARDVQARFAAHRAGTASRYTRAHPPKRIVYTEPAHSRSAALIREAAIKRLTKAKKWQLVSTWLGDNSVG
jgi:putative endonuclease